MRQSSTSLTVTFYALTLAALSGSALFLEIVLTRLFSTLFYPPYVYAIISLAVLGIGLGAALATWQQRWRAPQYVTLYLTMAGLTVLILLATLVWTTGFDLRGGLLLMVPLPYLFVGLAGATLFSAAPAYSHRLYQADLLGAGAGVLAAIPLLNGLGGINGTLLAAAGLGAAAVLGLKIAPMPGLAKYAPPLLIFLALGGMLASLWLGWLEIDMGRLSTQKPITESLARGGRTIYTAWDSFARSDLVDPGGDRPYELYIDGAAGSVMPPTGDATLLRTDIGFFPFATYQPERVLVIGPGGGLDIWFALSSRAREITAVEINPASVDIVNRFAGYHGDLYGRPGVRVRVDEGRSVLRRQEKQYDLIYLSQVVTLAAERSGYALTENSVYTVEAFQDYLAHLAPGGVIALKLYDELTLTRALITAVTALRESRGLAEAEAMAHVAAFLDPDADPPVPLLVVQNEPFEADGGLALAGVAVQVDFTPLFVPGIAGNPTLAAVQRGEKTVAAVAAESASDVSPTTDDRPFFYQFERSLPQGLRRLIWSLAGVVGAGAGLLVMTQRRYSQPAVRYAPLYFAALGLGFITVEIALIQQTRLFLGHPTLAVTTVLAVLLLGGGLGSGFAGGWAGTAARRNLAAALGGIVLLSLLWVGSWPWLSSAFLAGSIPIRVLVVVTSLAPLALLMGIPFPVGLRFVGRFDHGDRHVALGWAVNSVMTVAGSAMAMALAMEVGFRSVLLAGTGAYGLAIVLAVAARNGGKHASS